jgi:hypothetical protein
MTKKDHAARIETLLGAMTLDEKIGQLNMLTADLAVTGPGMPADYMAELKKGRLGSMLNLFGAPLMRQVQKAAVEETRLGIPLFFGFDVVHGHRTVFPIPLAEAGAFDPVQRPAAIAAPSRSRSPRAGRRRICRCANANAASAASTARARWRIPRGSRNSASPMRPRSCATASGSARRIISSARAAASISRR